MNRKDLAIYAILNSVQKTCSAYSVNSTEVRKAFTEQTLDSIPLIQRLRLLISNKALSSNIESAAKQFGLSTKVVKELLLDQVKNDPSPLYMMYQENKSCQALPGNEFLPLKRSVQTQASDGTQGFTSKRKLSMNKIVTRMTRSCSNIPETQQKQRVNSNGKDNLVFYYNNKVIQQMKSAFSDKNCKSLGSSRVTFSPLRQQPEPKTSNRIQELRQTHSNSNTESRGKSEKQGFAGIREQRPRHSTVFQYFDDIIQNRGKMNYPDKSQIQHKLPSIQKSQRSKLSIMQMFINRSGHMKPTKMRNIHIDTKTSSVPPASLRRLRHDQIMSKYKPRKLNKSTNSIGRKDAAKIAFKMQEKYDAIMEGAENFVISK